MIIKQNIDYFDHKYNLLLHFCYSVSGNVEKPIIIADIYYSWQQVVKILCWIYFMSLLLDLIWRTDYIRIFQNEFTSLTIKYSKNR